MADYDDDNSAFRPQIRGRMLPPQEPYIVRSMVETNEEDLPPCGCHMYSSTRKRYEFILFMMSFVALFMFWWMDYNALGDIRQRVLPYSILINRAISNNSFGNSLLKDLKTTKVENVATILQLTVWVYTISMIARVFFQLANFREEREDYSNKPHNSCPLSFVWFVNVCFICLTVLITSWESSILIKAVDYSGDILSDKLAAYAEGDLELKRAIDQFQMKFECCGSLNYTNWYKVDLYQFPDFAELAPEDPLREYLAGMFIAHYNLHDPTAPDPENIQNFIDAHRGDHAKNVNANGVYSSLLHTYKQKIFPIGSVPFSCCNPMSRLICPFYNHRNLDNTWKDVNFRDSIFTAPCNEVLQRKLQQIGRTVELINFWRFVWETFFFGSVHIILLSFQSDWEMNQEPTITACPQAWVWLCWIAIAFVFQYGACQFFSLRSMLRNITIFNK